MSDDEPTQWTCILDSDCMCDPDEMQFCVHSRRKPESGNVGEPIRRYNDRVVPVDDAKNISGLRLPEISTNLFRR